MNTPETATITIGDESYEFPLLVGSEGEVGIDIGQLRKLTGCITLDPGYGNTGSCTSAVTFVDGEKGILRHRGYPIEDLAANSSFIETAMLLIFGELPISSEREEFRTRLREQELLHEDLLHHFDGFPPNGQPMAILSAVVNSLSSYHPDLLDIQSDEEFRMAVAKIISKVRTIAAFSYRKSVGRPFMYPNPNLSYCSNFLHMMFSNPYTTYMPTPEAIRALSLFLIVHADHEQNCSCSTVRMVGSSQANLFASVSSGICALWGRLHGGANAAVIDMLDHLQAGDLSIKQYLELVKQKKMRLMGFGHRVYKNFDPRARILKSAAHNLIQNMDTQDDELIRIAQELEDAALNDDYFTSRKLYPNVDFYSGLILRALGIPVNMFPVMFAIGRMPGWIAHWYEEFCDPQLKIHRPRQVYIGKTTRQYIPIELR
ncbi:citrate synthase [Desulfovibrio inopinatus]|uniref:citrate synthase n=1 Tax=Desulfovibrio inopinatus TaxID=102109 RepID=UPI00041F371F|nr:citrate synthase [Desulfovibrio inopinatus]